MSDERIVSAEEARALREAATPGPWDAGAVSVYATADCPKHSRGASAGARVCGCAVVSHDVRDRDRSLIAAAPDLAHTVEALHARVAELTEAFATANARATDAEKARDANSKALTFALDINESLRSENERLTQAAQTHRKRIEDAVDEIADNHGPSCAKLENEYALCDCFAGRVRHALSGGAR